MRSLNVGTRFVRFDLAAETGYSLIEYDAGRVPTFVTPRGVAFERIRLTRSLMKLAGRSTALVYGMVAFRGDESARTLVQVLRARERRLNAFDANIRGPLDSAHLLVALGFADVFKATDEELVQVCAATGCGGATEEAAARNLMARFGIRLMAVTRGARGSTVISPDGSHSLAARRVDVVSTCGCGDAYFSGLLLGLLAGRSIPTSHAIAVAMAAYVATCPGAMPRLDGDILRDIERLLDQP
jgi:fructokinase